MTHISLFDPRIDPEAAKTLLKGDTIPVLEYECRLITDGRRIGTDGGIFLGPFKDQELWKSLYQKAMEVINLDIDRWILQNIDKIEPQVIKFPYRLAFVSLVVGMGISDDGQPYLKASYTALSDIGKQFIRSPDAERARLMALEIAGSFINRLGAT